MKKLLLSFFGLILCSALGWGASPVGYFSIEKAIATVASENGWVKPASGHNTYNTMNFDSNITFTVQDDNRNGVYRNGNCWAMYDTYAFGPFKISAASGYWIDSVALTYTPKSNAHLCDVGGVGTQPKPEYASGTPFAVKANVSNKYYTSTSNASVGGRIEITNFKVVYYKVPTSITLTSTSMSVGEQKTMAAAILPDDAYKTIKWSSSNTSVATIDETTGVMNAVAIGRTTITATGIDGKVKGTATVIVNPAEDIYYWTETFSKCTSVGGTAVGITADVDGDDGTAKKWNLLNFRRRTNESVEDQQGIQIRYDGHIASLDSIEGGIKEIFFDWKPQSIEAAYKILFNINVDESGNMVTDPCELAKGTFTADVKRYHHVFNYQKNAKLSITVGAAIASPNTQTFPIVGKINVIPYLLYKTKSAEAYASAEPYKNNSLVNYTGATPTFTLEGADKDKATIDEYGAVTILESGVVTVKASWNEGKVYTTYQLTMHANPAPTVVFADGDAVTKSMNLETYTNALNWTSDPTKCGAVTYESDNEEIAKFEDETVNVLSIVGEGTVHITAHIAKGSEFAAKDLTYALTVEDPNEDAITETFKTYKNGGWTGSANPEAERNGDYFKWKVYLARYKAGDDVIDSERAVCFNAGGTTKDGYIVSQDAVEGGIKRIGFNWKKNGVADGTFQVIVDGQIHTINSGATTISKAAYNHNFFEKSNATLKIFNNSQSKLWVGDIKITPYLLYTTKDTMVNVTEGTFINDKLYNNTNDLETTNFTYSVRPKDGVVSIADSHSGVVTVNAAGTDTIQVAWGDGVVTYYVLHINRVDMPTLTFEDGAEINKTMNDVPFNNKLNGLPESGIGTVTYSSTKPKVADVDDNGLVTIYGAGTTTITATITDGTIYSAASKSYTLEVSEPEGEKSYTETFKAYEDEGWDVAPSEVTTKDGDLFKWDVYKARHDKDRDSLFNKSRATWLNSQGYIRTTGTLQGGIKRISFKWNKVTQGSVRALFSLFWTEDNSGYDQVDVNIETGAEEYLHNPDFDYSHNFFLKRNVPLRIVNSKNNALLELGDIKITPYIFFTTQKAEISYEAYYQISAYVNPGYINNTNGEGTITFISSNPSIANPKNDGSCAVEILGYSEEPITITASWKPSDDAEACTASYQLIIHGKDKRKAKFDKDSVTVKVGETPVNEFDCKEKATATISYSSSETTVATINGSEVNVVGIGTTIIKAKVAESTYYMADSATYVLVVKPAEDAEHTLAESFNNVSFTSAAQQKLEGDLAQYGVTWDKNDVSISRNQDQTIGGKQGTWMRQAALLTTSDVMEGGVKYFSCYWRQPNTESNTTIKVGLFLDDAAEPVFATSDRRINDVAGTGSEQQYYYAANVEEKSNAKLTFKNLSNNPNTQNGRIIFDTLRIVPYLFYTAKDTTLKANEMGGVYTYSNDKLINNTDDAVADNFTYKVLAKDNAVSIADEHSDVLTIIGAGTDTIEAAWEDVKTTYVVHVVLEDAGLDFDEKTPVELLGTGSYTQTASKTTTAAVKYEFEGEHDGASIIETTGEVTFTKTGTFTILASVPVALPYNLDSARYTLTVNSKETPSITFNNVEKDMNAVAFQNPMNESYTGLGQAHYISTDPSVATVVENSGLITIVGQGDATINVHFDDGDDWAATDASFDVSVSDPGDDKLKENFVKQNNWGTSATSINGNLFTWNTVNTRRNVSKEMLANGDSAVWFSGLTSYIESAEKIEGGIKRVSFYYNKYDNSTVNLKFMLSVDGVKVDSACQADVSGITRAAEDFWFNHNLNVKANAKLRISHPVASTTAHLGYINITPYLYYTTKEGTIDLKTDVKTFQMTPQIDNRDDKATSSIEYEIIAGNEGSIATITADGTVTATGNGSGELTIQAKWSSNPSVTTTYTLTILSAATTIKLMRCDGTDIYDEITNNRGELMPKTTLPTREGYHFNAYFLDQTCTDRRFTVTMLTNQNTDSTGWVSNITYPKNGVNYTGDNRIWIYEGSNLTLYAQWVKEDTITLDNQGAATAGTTIVYTAYCQSNNTVNLMTPITVPQKPGYTFRGYYTEEGGAGTQLINADGAFFANVSGYTDTEKNFRKWIYAANITLYAYWDDTELTLDEAADNSDAIVARDGDNIATVKLNRTLATGKYNTFCLPFEIDKDDLAAALTAKLGEEVAITSLATLDATQSASLVDQKNLNIVITEVNKMEAGKPYLLAIDKEVVNPSFSDVTISAENTGIASSDNTVTFYGITSPKTIGANEKSILFVSNNKLNWNATGKDTPMKGLRAYFYVPGMTGSSGVAPRLVMRQPNTPTGTDNVNANVNVQKVLINDQIYIIRNGVYYNLNGQIAQ